MRNVLDSDNMCLGHSSLLECNKDNCYQKVGEEEKPELQDHGLLLFLLSVLNNLRLDACFNLELESHVQIKKHEPNRDEEREGTAGLVGDGEQGEECCSHRVLQEADHVLGEQHPLLHLLH